MRERVVDDGMKPVLQYSWAADESRPVCCLDDNQWYFFKKSDEYNWLSSDHRIRMAEVRFTKKSIAYIHDALDVICLKLFFFLVRRAIFLVVCTRKHVTFFYNFLTSWLVELKIYFARNPIFFARTSMKSISIPVHSSPLVFGRKANGGITNMAAKWVPPFTGWGQAFRKGFSSPWGLRTFTKDSACFVRWQCACMKKASCCSKIFKKIGINGTLTKLWI